MQEMYFEKSMVLIIFQAFGAPKDVETRCIPFPSKNKSEKCECFLKFCFPVEFCFFSFSLTN